MSITPDNLLAGMRIRPRSPYLSLVQNAMQQAMAYRARIVLSTLGNGIWIIVVYYLWRTVYASNTQVVGYTWDSMRTYLVVAYALNILLSFGSTSRLYNLVRTGEIAQELLRPIDYLGQQLALTLGAALIEGLVSLILTLVIGVVFIGMLPPATWLALVAFMPSVLFGFLIKFMISYLFAMLCFWTVNGLGLLWAQIALVNLFSGALIPLAFLPGWLGTLAAWAPFQGIIATPLAIYQGTLVGWHLAGALALQLTWIAILWGIAQLLWRPALRALDIQGG